MTNGMKSLLIFIGSLILSTFLFSFPAMTVLSFVLNWGSSVQLLLATGCAIEIITTTICTWMLVKESEV